MRKVVGWAVFVLGVGYLGFYAYRKSAVEIENGIAARSLQAVESSIHAVFPEVRGRDIRLVGIADSEAERDALMAAVDAVDGRRMVTDELTVLMPVTPFSAQLTKSEAPRAMVAAGVVPSARVLQELADAGWGEGASALQLASGAPEGWVDMAKAGAAALRALETGEMIVADDTLTITGTALSPVEYGQMAEALAGLPDGAVTLDVKMRDDGTPVAFDVTYDAMRGAEVKGKLPPGLTAFDLAEALGLSEMAGAAEVQEAVRGAPGDIGPFATLSQYLPDLEHLQITGASEKLKIVVEVGLAVDPGALQAQMQAEMGTDVDLSVIRAADNGMTGDLRTNAATGLQQRYAGGYWIAVPGFAPDKVRCQAETAAILDSATINFEAGSDVLAGDSVAVLNRLAEVVLHCAGTGALRAVIGGHTDSTGDALANLGLSQKRATAVRLALVARGVPPAMLKAIGFGAEQPIADNATEAGKARNRRITIEWVE